jgi:GT2 family glycosyltransferase
MVISLIVPTRNRRETLAHVLPTLARQTADPATYEILLCDYQSADGTRDLVAESSVPHVRLLQADRPGRSAGRNAGLAAARGRFVLFTDADILADAGLVEEHLRAHDRFPGSAIVGCEVRIDSLDEHRDVAANPSRRRHPHGAARRRLPWWFFVTGNASVEREAVVRVGGFDESFSGYGHEDLELGYRLARAGLPIRYHAAAVDYHWHPEPLDDRAAKMRLAGRSTIRFYRKHRDWRILARMGVNPFSLAWHRVLRPDGRTLGACRARAERSPLCRAIVLEHAYLTGVTEALADTSAGACAR